MISGFSSNSGVCVLRDFRAWGGSLHTEKYIRTFALDWEKTVDIFLFQHSCFVDEETAVQGDPLGNMKKWEESLALLTLPVCLI